MVDTWRSSVIVSHLGRIVEQNCSIESMATMMWSMRQLSPDWFSLCVNPRAGPTALGFSKRYGTLMALLKVSAVAAPAPGIVIISRKTVSLSTIDSSLPAQSSDSSRSFSVPRSR